MSEESQRAFVDSLSKAERVLIVIRDELYGGSWDELVADLHARRDRKPFVFKLNSRIEEDLSRIETLRTYEQEQGLDLRSLLSAGTEEGLPL